MLKVTVLTPTEKRYFEEKEFKIEVLDALIRQIFVPYKRKIKRKDKLKLLGMLENEEYVFSEFYEFFKYEKGVSKKSWLYYFFTDGIQYVTSDFSDTAVVAIKMNNLVKNTIVALSSIMRVLTVYKLPKENFGSLFDEIYESIGLPMNIVELEAETQTKESVLIRISEDILVYDKTNNETIYDLKLKFLYPLDKLNFIPLDKILKVLCNNGMCQDIIQKGYVKIVGKMSK